MNWKVIKTEAQYRKAVRRMMAIFHAAENTAEAEELALLLVLIKDYEDKHIQLPELNPMEVIKLKMEEQGLLRPKDLEHIIGSKGHVSSIPSGRRETTLKMAQKLKNYFQLPAEIFFANRIMNS